MPLSDTHFMRIALAEARKSDPFPNPNVGAVIVGKNGKIISLGHHEYSGGPHAELAALRKAGARAKGATLYVTLEPCSHTGKKTPPCTLAIIKAKVSRVVFGAGDANPSVSGKSILQNAGIPVTSGILASECSKLNTRITSAVQRNMPLVAARFAMSIDGKTATRTGHSFWISGPQARDHARKLRGSYDVLLVGANTVMHDNPLLTCRTPGMPEPLRVIADSKLRISPAAKVFTKPKIAIATSGRMDKRKAEIFRKLGVPLLLCGKEKVHLPTLLRKLFDLGKRSVLIEGGGEITGNAFDEGLVERIYSFIAPKIIGGEHAISPVRGIGVARADHAHMLKNMRVERLGEDIFVVADVLPAKR